jgi:hypothetical protein
MLIITVQMFGEIRTSLHWLVVFKEYVSDSLKSKPTSFSEHFVTFDDISSPLIYLAEQERLSSFSEWCAS